MKHKKALSAFLALLVIFQAACPLSAVAQDASAESQVAAAKRKGKAKRVFSTRSSVEPSTPQAAALAESLAKSLPSRLTSDTLRKFKLKPGKSALSVSSESKFSITDLAEDRTSWARGYASVSGGDAFALFLTGPNRVVGIVETYQRTVGNKKIDLEREAQLRAAGFKVNLLVDRFQVVLWESLDPEGIPATVAKPPTFVTAPLTPEQVHKIFFPKKRQSSGMSASADVAVPVGLAGAVGALGAPPANGAPSGQPRLKKFKVPASTCNCSFEKGPDTRCENPGEDGKIKECDYACEDKSKSKGETVGFYASADACESAIDTACAEFCGAQICKPGSERIKCIYPVVTLNSGESAGEAVKQQDCPTLLGTPKNQVFGASGACELQPNILKCRARNSTLRSATLLTNGEEVVCQCNFPSQEGPYCPGSTDIGCSYPAGDTITGTVALKSFSNPTAACENFCWTKWVKPDNEEIDCNKD